MFASFSIPRNSFVEGMCKFNFTFQLYADGWLDNKAGNHWYQVINIGGHRLPKGIAGKM